MLKPELIRIIDRRSACCIECQEPLNGRCDKKFCDDNCRTAYNNRVKSQETNFVRNVNNILRRNRRILRHFFSLESPRVRREQLTETGFLFSYFTRVHTVGKEKYTFVYEYGFMEISPDEILLVKSDDPPVSFH